MIGTKRISELRRQSKDRRTAETAAAAVADAWADPEPSVARAIWRDDPGFGSHLDALERATRSSPLRKVRP